MTKGICRSFLNEFKLTNCGFHHLPPEEFVKSQWQTCSQNIIFLIYRWLVAIFFVVVVGLTLFEDDTERWLIYLTHWGILLCLITTLLGAILVTLWHFYPDFEDKIIDISEMPIFFKIYWALHNITLILSLMITIVYWSILYNDKVVIGATNILSHVTNSVFMFIDLLIVAHPVRLMHIIQPICLGLCYALFTIIYYFAGGTDKFGNHYVYNVMNWDEPMTAITCIFGVLVLAIILHTIMFFIYQLRVKLYVRFFSKTSIIPTSVLQTASSVGGISMVFGHENQAFNGSTDKIIS